MRRGGREYYALDVTDRNAPDRLFKIGPNEAGSKRLTDAGQSGPPRRSQGEYRRRGPEHAEAGARVRRRLRPAQDAAHATDATATRSSWWTPKSGDLLWYAGPSTDTNADLGHPTMLHSIPGDVRVFDLTGDGFADRMYAADMGGRVWRFDIHNGQTRDDLVTGGVFASLGNAHLGVHPNASTRRFYSAPDVSFLLRTAAGPGSTSRSAPAIAGTR